MTAVLIAGGRSRRMGCAKCLLEWRGKPLWEHQLETLAGLDPDALAVAAPDRPTWLPAGVAWLPDAASDSGPLGGILAGLNFAASGPVVVLAVDLPMMTTGYLRKLMDASGELCGAVPFSGTGYEPVSAVYPVGAAGAAGRWLQAGRRDLQGWVAGLVRAGLVRSMESGDAELFQNWNRPEDLVP